MNNKKITIKDIADLAGVSKSTVSRVINGKAENNMKKETQEQIEKIIEELNYRPNKVAQSLSTNKSHTIGLIISDISNTFYSNLARGVGSIVDENDYTLSIFNTDEVELREKKYLDSILQRQFDGVIIAPIGKNIDLLNNVLDNGIPIVFVDRYIKDFNADAVLSDGYQGAYNAVEYLISMNHKEIGIILGLKRNILSSKERFQGYHDALRDNNIEFKEEYVMRGDSKTTGGYNTCKKLLENQSKISALFCTNNLTTLGALEAVDDKKLAIPKDISIIGFDELPLAGVLHPRLSLVAQKPELIGKRAAELLFERLNKNQKNPAYNIIRIDTELKKRDTVAKL